MNAFNRNRIQPLPTFFDRYILEVEEDDLIQALGNSLEYWDNFDWDRLEKIGNRVYQEGKWTVKDILQHINDNERVQSYRILRFARNDQTALAGYDEDLFVANANANSRSLDELRDEFMYLRKSSCSLLKSCNAETLMRTGICFEIEMSVLALGFVLVGHQIHHMKVIEERYFPLVK
ncbi:MAG: DinB family protein [Bacteroidia bacterium]|nr:DinB family protein [Bacteroidota bacterium]MBP6511413.1 DinB family protein [Bacteroidia bacterium]MBP7245113.1 DinB family protein [Bacteroidia bacterium]